MFSIDEFLNIFILMFIRKISIKDYKNLRNLHINFTQNINVFIGQNGSGKSALIEVILEIFANLMLRPVKFDKFESTLTYNKGNIRDLKTIKPIQVHTKDGKIWKNQDEHTPDLTVLNPTKIVVYYSGGNKILEKLTRKYNNRIKSKNAKTSTQLPTISYIDDDFYKLCLIVAQLSNLPRFKNLLERYKVEEKGFEFGFKFGSSKSGVVRHDDADASLLLAIFNANKEDVKEIQVDTLDTGQVSLKNIGSVFFELSKVKEKINGSMYESDTASQLIKLIYEDKLIKKIYLNCYKDKKYISNENTTDQNSSIFSEGEKQRFVIECLGEIFPDGDTLFLLDEPDAFMHPQWQSSFMSEIVEPATKNGANFVITTHSPYIIQNLEKESVFIIENGQILKNKVLSYGKDISTVSYEFMGVKERPKEIQDKLDILFETIELDPNEDKIEALYTDLVSELGADDKDLIYAKTLIDFNLYDKNNEA